MWFTPSLALHWHVAEREEIATAQGSCEEHDSPIWPKKEKKSLQHISHKTENISFQNISAKFVDFIRGIDLMPP